jgi:5'-nucleotidase
VLHYPEEVLDLAYSPRFPVRGLWFDREYGNLLKVDQFGKILRCCHGFRSVFTPHVGRKFRIVFLFPRKRFHISGEFFSFS